MRTISACVLLIVCCTASFAEDFRIEFTGSLWILRPSGTVQTTSTRVDLRTDLGIEERKVPPVFKLVAKPGQRHRIDFELIPYKFEGSNLVSRTFQLGGVSYSVQDRITSEAKLLYLFGGYQFDFVNTPQGHAGIGGGVAYFDADASATSQTLNATGREQRKVAVPLVGGEFRAFLIPGKQVLNVNGEVKGISLGSWGRYFQASGNAGVAVSRHVRLQAGFNFVDADLHNKEGVKGFKTHFSGPIFSVQLHD